MKIFWTVQARLLCPKELHTKRTLVQSMYYIVSYFLNISGTNLRQPRMGLLNILFVLLYYTLLSKQHTGFDHFNQELKQREKTLKKKLWKSVDCYGEKLTEKCVRFNSIVRSFGMNILSKSHFFNCLFTL